MSTATHATRNRTRYSSEDTHEHKKSARPQQEGNEQLRTFAHLTATISLIAGLAFFLVVSVSITQVSERSAIGRRLRIVDALGAQFLWPLGRCAMLLHLAQ